MPKTLVSRKDIEGLIERMESRSNSPLLHDMPQLRGDIRLAALCLRHMVMQGMSPTGIEVGNNNGNP